MKGMTLFGFILVFVSRLCVADPLNSSRVAILLYNNVISMIGALNLEAVVLRPNETHHESKVHHPAHRPWICP